MYHRYWLPLTSLLVAVFLAQGALAHCATPGTADKISQIDANADDQICDPQADYYLGMENYPKAVALHRAVIARHPNLAVAYYHLGFAYGIMGDRHLELKNYQHAVSLGLDDWALFLNLGRLYLESGHLEQADDAFRLATLLAPQRPEGHYNLGLTYERLGLLAKAEQETLLALRLGANQVEAHNTLAIIYAEEGNLRRAHQEWLDLIKSDPQYAPARANLAIVERAETNANQGGRQVAGFTQAP